MNFLAPTVLMVFPACLIVAAVSDIRRFVIPNTLSLILMGGFIVAALTASLPWSAIGGHVLLAIATLAVGFGLFCAGVFGGGDAKLLAVVSLWLGPHHILPGLFWIAVCGGVLALAMIILRRLALAAPQLMTPFPALARLATAKTIFAPYGVAIAAGALIVFPESVLFDAAAR